MYINIEIINKKSNLFQEIFIFHLLEHPLRLEIREYALGERKTQRHKFQTIKFWSKTDKRSCTTSKIPLTDNIRKQAKLKLLDLFADITVS